MNVTKIELRSFRNIDYCSIEPCDGINVIHGRNAQGKTNLLEGIWLFTGCRSFRGSRDGEMIGFDKPKAILGMDFYAFGREQNAHIEIGDGKKYHLGGVKMKGASEMMGNFLSIVFSPEHLSLIKDGPYERRRFLDIAISQLKPKYAGVLSQYNKAVAQRNVLLKDIQMHSELYDTLDIWEDRIAFFASELIRQRIGYAARLSENARDIYSGLSSGKEELKIIYDGGKAAEGVTKGELYENMKKELVLARKNDLMTGSTSVGPHRDDLIVEINGLSARSFGSQGQQRSAALALKLGEAAVISSFCDEQPVALLDDVMSELDETRQNYILNHIKDWQVFITCCDPETVKNLKSGEKFNVSEGKVK